MLTREGATVALDQLGGRPTDLPEEPLAVGGFQVEDGPQVQLPRARVGVVDGGQAKALMQEAVHLGNVGGQVRHGHRGVFDHGHRLIVARHVLKEPLPRFTEVPDFDGVLAEKHRKGVAEARGA